MKVRILYFGELREQVGLHEETMTVVTITPTVADLMTELTARGAEWAQALESTEPLRIAVDQEMAQPTARLSPNCEVAFFRPVTGG